MGIGYIFMIALGLSIDCLTISVTATAVDNRRLSLALKLAVIFGLFHIAMPIIGWLLGEGLKQYIETYDHWVAFGLLLLLGGKMIYESIKSKNDEDSCGNYSNVFFLIGLAVASSIDALVIGVSLSVVHVSVYYVSIIIGSVTFIVTLLGGYFGNKISRIIKFRFDFIGGIVLILIGGKILMEHLT